MSVSYRDYVNKLQRIAEYGVCSVPMCGDPRTKSSTMCLDHAFTNDENLDVTLVHEFMLTCIFCSYQHVAIGTRENERIARMVFTIKCPTCGNPLALEDEHRIVGRIVTPSNGT